MTILFILILFTGAVCEGVVLNVINGDKLNKDNKKYMYGCVSGQIIMGVLICWLVNFNIEFYDANERDFYDYGEITAEGVIYFLMWIGGASYIAGGIINLVRLAVTDLKESFAEVLPKLQDSVISSAISNTWKCSSCGTGDTMDDANCQKFGAGKNVRQEVAAVEASRETITVVADTDIITCPKCGTVQKRNRTCCFECGVQFDVQQ